MSDFSVDFYSNSLRQRVSFKMFIPNDKKSFVGFSFARPAKTVFLLHGYTDSACSYGAEQYAAEHNIALVMPNGENSFYLDGEADGRKFCTFVGAELVEYVRSTFGLARDRNNTLAAGISMGGFGAIHTALSYPETFGKAAALSPALIVHDIAKMKPGESNGVANYAYYRECFGDLDIVEQSRANPETLVSELISDGKRLPELFICCGTEDFLIEPNRRFHGFLTEKGVPHQYFESKGVHDMKFWGEYLPKAIAWLAE